MELKVDEEFKDYLEAASDVGRDELIKVLADSGGPTRPIEVWKEEGVIVDGHRRYEICTSYGLGFKVKELSFPSREAVFAYMDSNQIASRNLSDFAKAQLIERRARRLARSGKPPIKTLSEETGRSRSSIKRDIKLAKNAEGMIGGWKEAVRTNSIRIPKRFYKFIAKLGEREQESLLQKCIESGEPIEVLAEHFGLPAAKEYAERSRACKEEEIRERLIERVTDKVETTPEVAAMEPVPVKPTRDGALSLIEQAGEKYVALARVIDRLFTDEGLGAKWKGSGFKREFDQGLRKIAVNLEELEKAVRKK